MVLIRDLVLDPRDFASLSIARSSAPFDTNGILNSHISQ